VGHLPVFLVREPAFHRAEGVEVVISELAGGSKAMQAIVGGSADGSGSRRASLDLSRSYTDEFVATH
jgi:ABC-type nitrate/sulfonate/bicarbonate transport system substrate-binding protein